MGQIVGWGGCLSEASLQTPEHLAGAPAASLSLSEPCYYLSLELSTACPPLMPHLSPPDSLPTRGQVAPLPALLSRSWSRLRPGKDQTLVQSGATQGGLYFLCGARRTAETPTGSLLPRPIVPFGILASLGTEAHPERLPSPTGPICCFSLCRANSLPGQTCSFCSVLRKALVGRWVGPAGPRAVPLKVAAGPRSRDMCRC